MNPTITHRAIFTFGFLLSVYVIPKDFFLGILIYFVAYWVWLTFLSYESLRPPIIRSKNPRINKIVRVLSILGICLTVLIIGTFGFAPFRFLMWYLGIFQFSSFLVPILFLATVIFFIIDLNKRIEIQIFEDSKLSRILMLSIYPIGLWTIHLKKAERKIYH
jgi:hypothetical protein